MINHNIIFENHSEWSSVYTGHLNHTNSQQIKIRVGVFKGKSVLSTKLYLTSILLSSKPKTNELAYNRTHFRELYNYYARKIKLILNF